MTEPRSPGQAPSQVARRFLELLNDVQCINGMCLDEITALRARIAELEASKAPCMADNAPIPAVLGMPSGAVYPVSQDGRIVEGSLHQAVLLDETGHACGRMHVEIPMGVLAEPLDGSGA